MMDFQAVRWTVDGVVPPQEGKPSSDPVPMGCFPTSDGFVNVAGSGGRLLVRLCDAIGLPELPADPRFDTAAKRSTNRAELNELVAERIATKTTTEWVTALNGAGVPCGPVLRTDEVFADPQVIHLGMVAGVRSPASADFHIAQRGHLRRRAGHSALHRVPSQASTPPRCCSNSDCNPTRSTTSGAEG